MTLFKQVLSLAAATVAFIIGIYLMWEADGINTQFGVGLLLVSYSPSILEKEEER